VGHSDRSSRSAIRSAIEASVSHEGPRLQLISEFGAWADGPVFLPRTAQRVLAFLALARGRIDRSRVAGALWSDATQARADGNLRSALWRLGARGLLFVERRSDTLALAKGVSVDVLELDGVATGILDGGRDDAMRRLPDLVAGTEILPTWDEWWLVTERERYRHARLHALEAAGQRLLRSGDCGRAISLGLVAVQADPLRESAHRLLIASHLGEGNASEAIRDYLGYRRLVEHELGVAPSQRMEALIQPFRDAVESRARE
jgi:DNA-binding SARP family transcriptional activator